MGPTPGRGTRCGHALHGWTGAAPQLRAATRIPELPAIFLSARVDRETVEAAHRLGAAYLAKPFMEEILYAAIEAAITNGHQGLWTVVEALNHRSPSP